VHERGRDDDPVAPNASCASTEPPPNDSFPLTCAAQRSAVIQSARTTPTPLHFSVRFAPGTPRYLAGVRSPGI
jgi:hypothetical protein